MTEEVWKTIDRIAGYQFSSLGRIIGRRGKIINGGRDKDGYAIMSYGPRATAVTLKVHRLIYEAFNGPIPDGLMINHLNGIKDDNRLENIETCNASQTLLA